MQTFYKGYRVVTERKGKSTDFDIFLGTRCEAMGFVMDEWTSKDIDMAAERAKDLIDIRFETPMLQDIRKISKY